MSLFHLLKYPVPDQGVDYEYLDSLPDLIKLEYYIRYNKFMTADFDSLFIFYSNGDDSVSTINLHRKKIITEILLECEDCCEPL
jgi:hypothetical protein